MSSISVFHALIEIGQATCFSSQSRLWGISRPVISYSVPAGQAMTVRVHESGVLRIQQGRLWLTFSPANGNGNGDNDCCPPAGGYFLECGDGLPLAAGQIVVIEMWAKAAPSEQSAAAPARVSWEADAPRWSLVGLRRVLNWRVAWRRRPHPFVFSCPDQGRQ